MKHLMISKSRAFHLLFAVVLNEAQDSEDDRHQNDQVLWPVERKRYETVLLPCLCASEIHLQHLGLVLADYFDLPRMVAVLARHIDSHFLGASPALEGSSHETGVL